MALTIAIDGPVGAGKSTVAKALAEALDILHLDTGAMYRALALKALREGVDPHDAVASEAICKRTRIDVLLRDGGQRTCLDGADVTDEIRTPAVSAAASAISKARGVRESMVALQRRYAAQSSMVLDGRDIGTRVLPDATYKFYLDAPPEARAKRRFEELAAKGAAVEYGHVLAELIARDAQDTGREADPLRRAEDAQLVDTGGLTRDEVVDLLMRIVTGDTTNED